MRAAGSYEAALLGSTWVGSAAPGTLGHGGGRRIGREQRAHAVGRLDLRRGGVHADAGRDDAQAARQVLGARPARPGPC